jgi:hypothetical protein
VPTEAEIVGRHLDTIALIKRGVSGSKLKPAEALDCLDLLGGLDAALRTHPHFDYATFECARMIAIRAAAEKSIEKSNS